MIFTLIVVIGALQSVGPDSQGFFMYIGLVHLLLEVGSGLFSDSYRGILAGWARDLGGS